MQINYLEFEHPIIRIEEKINFLKKIRNQENENLDIDKEISNLKKKKKEITKKIFNKLDPWQVTQLARHPMRPYTLDYIKNIFEDFDEISGDRISTDDKSIIGGIAKLNSDSVVIIGHQKGRDTKEKIMRNFGMTMPGGYRKALRIMQIANKFKIPLITFIDTPGAYPGIKAESQGQAEAIAKNLKKMSCLKIPIICNIIGEGGSGGALAIGVGDKINMLQYSIYSVISPEGCATILWKDIKKASLAAKSMKIIAEEIKKLNIIDNIIPEPLGGAHRNLKMTSKLIKERIKDDLQELRKLSTKELLNRRYKKIMNYGYNI